MLHDAATKWARADRVADDRAAELLNLERLIARISSPVPPELVRAREIAQRDLTDACQLEGQAEEDLREAARKLLDVHVVTPHGDP
jgi:hypothetical protein